MANPFEPNSPGVEQQVNELHRELFLKIHPDNFSVDKYGKDINSKADKLAKDIGQIRDGRRKKSTDTIETWEERLNALEEKRVEIEDLIKEKEKMDKNKKKGAGKEKPITAKEFKTKFDKYLKNQHNLDKEGSTFYANGDSYDGDTVKIKLIINGAILEEKVLDSVKDFEQLIKDAIEDKSKTLREIFESADNVKKGEAAQQRRGKSDQKEKERKEKLEEEKKKREEAEREKRRIAFMTNFSAYFRRPVTDKEGNTFYIDTDGKDIGKIYNHISDKVKIKVDLNDSGVFEDRTLSSNNLSELVKDVFQGKRKTLKESLLKILGASEFYNGTQNGAKENGGKQDNGNENKESKEALKLSEEQKGKIERSQKSAERFLAKMETFDWKGEGYTEEDKNKMMADMVKKHLESLMFTDSREFKDLDKDAKGQIVEEIIAKIKK
ncbi:MAG: hypothetical protein WCV59_00290 [Parcubacteria group bacterium]|jgi:hypothetical protein